MREDTRIDRIYAQLMRDHPYGWALYKKVTRRDIFPGSCGYFDADGDWRGITNLNHADDLAKQGWKMPGNDISSNKNPESMTWGPKISGSVKSSHIGGTIGANISVAPIEASASVLFKTESENGAVLTSESPVTRHAIGEERSAVQWMVDNKSEMLRLHGDVFKRHGIWIITKTYSTRRCAIAVMTARSSSVKISLDADTQGVLTLTPKSAWSSSTGSCCTEVHEDEEDGVVVFISGIYFSPKLLGRGWSHRRSQREQKDKVFRGDGQGATVGTDDGDETVELDMEFYPPVDEDSD